MPRPLTENDVTFTVECQSEDIPVRGNAMASEDPEVRETEDWILSQLNQGNEWAWCYIVVTAEWSGFKGRDSLGGCSYRSEAEFLADVYFADMKSQALDDLNKSIAELSNKLASLG